MSIDNTALDALKDISKKCHDMLCMINTNKADEYDLISLIFNIREQAAKTYNIHNNQDLIQEFNQII